MLVDGEKLKTAMLFKMRDLIEVLPGTDSGFTFNLKLFDKLVKKNQVPLQPPDRIEAAIRYLEKEFDEMKKAQGHPWDSYWDLMRNVNLLKYVLNQPQKENGYPGSTWPKDFGLVLPSSARVPTEEGLEKETPNQKGR